MTAFDAIVLGAGIDGLTAALTLARAGRRTLVLDERDFAGGRAARVEFHPGFTTPGLLPDDAGLRRALFEGLGLEAHGLTWRNAPPAVSGADGLHLAGAPGSGSGSDAGVTAGDAEALAAWRQLAARLAPVLARLVGRPVPPRAKPELGEALTVLRTAFDLRRLPAFEFHELQRVAAMAVGDWLDERFASPALRALLAAPALAGSHVGPRAAGTALPRLVLEANRSGQHGHGGVVGGPAALVDALLDSARSAGVELRLGARLESLVVEDGCVRGARLADGEELPARDVLSTLGIARSFDELCPRGSLPLNALDTARHWRTRGDTSVLRLALRHVPSLLGADRLPERFVTAEHPSVQERVSDALKYGRLPERVWLNGWLPTAADPALAPAGNHVLVLAIHGTPYHLEGGWTEAAGGALQELALCELERVAPGIRDGLVATELLTPADLESRYLLAGGHLARGETVLDQLFLLRPGLAYARYATPLAGLWLAGSDTHPGGFAPAGAGALAAQVLLATD